MSDFVIKKKEEREHKYKSFLIEHVTKKKLSIAIKLVVFFSTFLGLIYLSISRDNLLLSEILTVGGILSMVFFIHLVSEQ